jgi:hypothetical protein
MRIPAALAALVIIATPAAAQSPYAGMQARPVKALSANDVADLKAGRGVGLALAAELNGYPGPSHVLELADKLGLSSVQKGQIQQLFDSMKAEAVPLGLKLIDRETALDQEFSGRTITAASLKTAMTEIGAIQSDLRTAHLKYHLQTVGILSPEQVKQYAVLRGYDQANPIQHHHRH